MRSCRNNVQFFETTKFQKNETPVKKRLTCVRLLPSGGGDETDRAYDDDELLPSPNNGDGLLSSQEDVPFDASSMV